VAGHGDPPGDLLGDVESLDVGGDGGGGIEDRVLEQLGFIRPDPFRVAAAEVVVGERARSALRVVDDGHLEERPVGNGGLRELSDERDRLDDVWSDTTTAVANDERIAELELEEMSRIDAVVEARENEQSKGRKGERSVVAAGGGEGEVAVESGVEASRVLGVADGVGHDADGTGGPAVRHRAER
jgi:hypothetical protein